MAREALAQSAPSPLPPTELPEQKLSAGRSRSSNAVSWIGPFCRGHLTVSCKRQGTGQGRISNGAVEPLTSKALRWI